jgi:Tfp pilus assembly protein PilV
MMRTEPIHSQRAFSMVEVIVASVILMATIILVFGTIAKTRQPVVDSSRKLRAAMYAQDVLDALRALKSATLIGERPGPGLSRQLYVIE